MSRTPPSHALNSSVRSSSDHTRRAASDEVLSLNKVLGDLGAWLEETEHHRKTALARSPTVN